MRIFPWTGRGAQPAVVRGGPNQVRDAMGHGQSSGDFGAFASIVYPRPDTDGYDVYPYSHYGAQDLPRVRAAGLPGEGRLLDVWPRETYVDGHRAYVTESHFRAGCQRLALEDAVSLVKASDAVIRRSRNSRRSSDPIRLPSQSRALAVVYSDGSVAWGSHQVYREEVLAAKRLLRDHKRI